MVLSFKPQFIDKINEGIKVHTIREDKKRRYEPGLSLHHATGVRTKNYFQFYSGTVESVQRIVIWPKERKVFVLYEQVYELSVSDIELLATNDGFDTVEAFWDWFTATVKGQKQEVFTGFIVAWDKAIIYPSAYQDNWYEYADCVEPYYNAPYGMQVMYRIRDLYPQFPCV